MAQSFMQEVLGTNFEKIQCNTDDMKLLIKQQSTSSNCSLFDANCFKFYLTPCQKEDFQAVEQRLVALGTYKGTVEYLI